MGKNGYFARDCIEPKKVTSPLSSLYSFVSSHVLIAHSVHDWIADTGVTRHVSRDRDGFVDYHRVLASTNRVFMGNGTCEEALGVGSYQLHLCTWHTLYVHNVLYVLGIQYNLLSILALLELGFVFQFGHNKLDIILDGITFEHSY